MYEGTIDRGSGVREKSKQLVELLVSNEMIRTEREKASNLRNKFVGIGNNGSRGSTGPTSGGYSGSGGGNGGGGGGSSYGNSGDRGFGNSYSDRDSNSGGGNDNYSSNSGGSNSRYSSDNYDSNRNGDKGSNSGSGSNGRYRDEYPTETVAAKKKSYDDEDEDEVKIKHRSKSASKLAAPINDTAIGGKLKLSIKKGVSPSGAGVTAPVPQQEVNMMDLLDSGGDSDFMSAPVVSAAPKGIMFDAFSAPVAAAPQSFQDDFGFSSFSAAPAPVQQAPAFDPFGMGSAPVQTQMQAPVMAFSQPQFQSQPPMIPQQSFGQFSSPMQAAPVLPPAPAIRSQFDSMSQMQSPMAPQQSFGQFNGMQAPPVPSMQPAMQQQSQQQQYQQPQQQPQQQQYPMNAYGSQSAPQAPVQQQQVFRGIVKAPEPDYGDFEGSGPAGTTPAASVRTLRR